MGGWLEPSVSLLFGAPQVWHSTLTGRHVIGKPRSITVTGCPSPGRPCLTLRQTSQSVLTGNSSAEMENVLPRSCSVTSSRIVPTDPMKTLVLLIRIPTELPIVISPSVSSLTVSALLMDAKLRVRSLSLTSIPTTQLSKSSIEGDMKLLSFLLQTKTSLTTGLMGVMMTGWLKWLDHVSSSRDLPILLTDL